MIKKPKAVLFVLGSVSVCVLLVAMSVQFAPKLVWNASQSAPIGLYWIVQREAELGEFVLVSPPIWAGKLIEEREYLPSHMPLIKRIAALPGDEICREQQEVFINKNFVADAKNIDSNGRKMPNLSGCFTLKNNERFLLNEHENSLDGRYFGVTKTAEIIGVAIPVFMKE